MNSVTIRRADLAMAVMATLVSLAIGWVAGRHQGSTDSEALRSRMREERQADLKSYEPRQESDDLRKRVRSLENRQ